jgi:hypothetical protein
MLLPAALPSPSMRRPLLALSLATVLVVAGCAGPLGGSTATPTEPATPTVTPTATPTPTVTPTPTATSTPEPDVEVKYGDTAVDETLVFDRVERLTGRDTARPTVYLEGVDLGGLSGTVYEMLGMTDQQFPADRATALTKPDGRISFQQGGNRTSIERTLAHEYVHVVQFEAEMLPAPGTYVDEVTVDSIRARRMALEGGAVFVTDAYVRAHMPDARLQSAVFATDYEHPPTPETRLALAPYHLGYRYVNARVDDPENLSAAYDPMPATTEQALHYPDRAGEHPASLSTTVTTDGNWSKLREGNRQGELFVRVLLRTELDRERAVEAAAGWGNDHWMQFHDGDDDGDGFYDVEGAAWVLRWDSAADADEFAAAARTFTDRRATNTTGSFTVRRLDDDTVAMLVGTDSFLGNASVAVEDDGVTVDVGPDGSSGATAGRASPDAVAHS